MARIRTVKPEFFRDEDLQDLERANPGLYTMLVFSGLWGHCDKNGNFEWRPRTLKLDILPFLEFDMNVTLHLLLEAGFIKRYAKGGKDYGHIPTFTDHQRIGGKEAQEPGKHPKFTDASPGSDGEALGKHQGLQEGKGREGKGEGEERARAVELADDWKPPDWVKVRLLTSGASQTWTPQIVGAYVAHYRAQSIVKTEKEWGELFVKWMLREPSFSGGKIASPDADGGWAEFREATRAGRLPAAWKHPRTAAAIEALGGWAVLKNAESKTLDFKEREFKAAFARAA